MNAKLMTKEKMRRKLFTAIVLIDSIKLIKYIEKDLKLSHKLLNIA